MRTFIAWLPLLLAACAGTSAGPPATAEAGATLARYHWQLQQATDASGTRITELFARPDRPLQLDFADGRISISHACNRIGGPYTLVSGRLHAPDLASTRMACADPAIAALDDAIARRIDDTMTGLEEQDAQPVLTLVTRSGDVLRFVGEPTAAGHDGATDEVFLEGAAEPGSPLR